MTFVDHYPEDLETEGVWDSERADQVIYRRVHRALPVSGLPGQVEIDGSSIHFVEGPIRTQQTTLRQRSGWPVVFDKTMKRGIELGSGELLCVIQRAYPTPADPGAEVEIWRRNADSVAGLLTLHLDERVCGVTLAEDAIVFSDGAATGAMDVVSRVRHFMPFDVTSQDQKGLASLGGAALTLRQRRALKHYRAAAQLGPSVEACTLLWYAVDALSEDSQVSVKTVEALLQGGGSTRTGLPTQWGDFSGFAAPTPTETSTIPTSCRPPTTTSRQSAGSS